MRKLFLLAIAITFYLASSAQYKIDMRNIKRILTNDEEIPLNTWCEVAGQELYIYSFDKTPVGIKNSCNMLDKILTSNNKIRDKGYDWDSSFMSPDIKDIEEFEDLHKSIQENKSVISRAWTKGDWELNWRLEKSKYRIMLYTKGKH